MANPEHLHLLGQGVWAWNQWRDQHANFAPDLHGASLRGASLREANLRGARLDETDLRGARLDRARLDRASLFRANLLRADLRGANLFGADLSEANLSEADLDEANLGRPNLRGANPRRANLLSADLSEADLSRADLSRADLGRTILRGANLVRADLSEANLTGARLDRARLFRANLSGADLTGVNLSHGVLSDTVFGNTNLTAVQGLETCFYEGPSILDHRTLAKSGPLPLAFLRGCGLNDWEIEATKLYQRGLTPTQINDIVYRIYALRADPLIQFYSCFISHASKDHGFAERLYTDLQNKGVRCWFAPEDMKAGDRIRDTIEQQIRLREKLLLILSSASIASTWVEDEVEAALEEERLSPERRTVLVPIKVDDAIEETSHAWARTIKRTRHIGDFTHWKEEDAYQEALTRLLRGLTTTERQTHG